MALLFLQNKKIVLIMSSKMPIAFEEKNFRRQNMNVGSINQNMFTKYARPTDKNRSEASISFEEEGRRMDHTAFKKDDMINQFWSMTDSMPKENQISLTASVMASKVFNKESTPETKNFLQNVSNKFSPEEIGTLKAEIRNHPLVRNKAMNEVEKFMNEFDTFISSQQSTQMESLQKQQANPKFKSVEEIFFQMTLNEKPLIGQASTA